MRRIVLLVLCCALSSAEVLAGNGARHFMEGAFFSKYLTKRPHETTRSRIETYSTAFFVGALSHGLSDHVGNYEAKTGDPEYYYFIGEGLLACILLYPEWKKDPRLFYGSIGGVSPDLDQVEPFGTKIYPTHDGSVPHYQINSLWRGIVFNLAISGVMYYGIRRDLLSDTEFRSRFSLGYTFSYWDTQGAIKRDFKSWPSDEAGTPLRTLHLTYETNQFITMNFAYGAWLRETSIESDMDYPPRLNVDFYSLCLEMHPKQTCFINPYLAIGPGYYLASFSGEVNRGGISFSTFADETIGLQAGGGLRFCVSRYLRLVADARYHQVWFEEFLDTDKEFSGWSWGLGIEHRL